MADKPLPKGDGGGLVDAINSGNQKIFGIIGRQQRDINSLGKNTADLTAQLTADNLVIVDLLIDMSESLGRIAESLVPVGKVAQEQIENGPQPQAAPGVIDVNFLQDVDSINGGGDSAGTDKAAKSTGNLATKLGGLAGVIAGGGIGGASVGIAALIASVGVAAAGIGAGLLMGAKAVDVFGEGLSSVAEGMEDLNNTDIDLMKFAELGAALQALMGGATLGGATSLMIIAATDMKGLAEGIERLNVAKFEKANLEKAGEGIGSFLDKMNSSGALGGAVIGQMVDDNLIPLAVGLERLSAAELPEDFATKLPNIGTALGQFVSNLGQAGFGDAIVAQMIDDNLIPLAEGLEKLGPAAAGIDGDFAVRMGVAGTGIKNLIEGIDLGLFGAFFGKGAGLQAIDENLEPLARGVQALSEVNAVQFATNAPLIGTGMNNLLGGFESIMGVLGAQMVDDNLPILRQGVDLFAEAPAQQFKERAALIGDGFQSLFDGTDDLLGVMGAQMIDDNLPMLRKGVDLFAEAPAEEFAKKAPFVGAGFRDLLAGFGGEGIVDGLGKMLAGFNMQMIDDNLLPLATAIKAFSEVDAAAFAANAPQIGEGLNLMVEPLSAFGDAVKDIDPEILQPVAELVRYASELMADDSITQMAEGVNATVQAAKDLSDSGQLGTFNNFEQLITNLGALQQIDAGKLLTAAAALRSLAANAPVEGTGEAANMANTLGETSAASAKPTVQNIITDASQVMNQVNAMGGGNRAPATPAMVQTGHGNGYRAFT